MKWHPEFLIERKKAFMVKKIFAAITVTVIVVSCAVQQPAVKEEKIETGNLKLPGIDDLTAMMADSVFSQVTVDYDEANKAYDFFDEAQLIEELADSLWSESQSGLHNGHDSLIALQQISRSEIYLQRNSESYVQTARLMKKLGKLQAQVLADVSKKLLIQGVDFFENAIRHDRFNISYRQEYCKFLQKVAARIEDKNYLIKAAEELERVVFVIKGQHGLYYDLGEIYSKLGDWKNAFKNYDLAKDVLRKSAIFIIPDPEKYFDRISEVPVDTNRLVRYLNQQAVCKTKLYEAQPALALYREVQAITPDIDLKQRFQGRIDWILWDDGNIRASEIKEKGDSLGSIDKNYVAAKKVYLESLLPILWTKRTMDETNWNIARLDFQNLGNKAEGVQRMFYVIKSSAIDSSTGAPLDSNYVRYFNDYGNMCFNLGSEFLEKDKVIAYIYFQQAAVTNYKEQGKAFLQVAKISQFDPYETIALCKKTMNFLEELDDSEKVILYEVMHRAYRKLGDFENAQYWFEKFNTF